MAPLDAVLAALLARTGAQAARVVDGRTGAVVAQAGVDAGDDVATLVAIARESGPPAAGCDLVVATHHAVHVLRSAGTVGTFLHVRLAHGRGDLPTTRRELASPALDAAVRHALDRTVLDRP